MKAYWKNFELNAKYIGVKGAPWNSLNKDQWQIVVCNLDTKKWTTFDYWARKMDTPKEVLKAFCNWLDDAYASRTDFINFCFNYGYTLEDLTKAKKVYRLCENAYKKWMRVSDMTDDDGMDFFNNLCEENDI